MFFRWTFVCFLYWAAWKCEAGHRRALSSTNNYKKNTGSIIMGEESAKSFFHKRWHNQKQKEDNKELTKFLINGCCFGKVCDFDERAYSNAILNPIFQGLCEVSIREGRICKCRATDGEVYECAADTVGKLNCEHPCPSFDDFYCSYDRKCVPHNKRCDSYNDCENWLDEKNCTITDTHNKSSIISSTELKVFAEKSKYYGDVFIFNRPVCYIGFNLESASVICKTLGFSESTKALFHKENFFGGIPLSNYIMGNVNCTGNESYIGECYHETLNSCNEYGGSVGVTCLDMTTLQLVSNSSSTEGYVYLIDLPFVSSFNGLVMPKWTYKEAQVVCNYFFEDSFDRGTKGVPVYSYNDSEVIDSLYCLGLKCPDEETNSITQCQISLHKYCDGFKKYVKCAKCTPKQLLKILDGLSLEGGYTQLVKSAGDALSELDQSCYFWTDCNLPEQRYPEYCLVRGFLDDILSLSINKDKNNVIIETSINPMKLLESNFLNQQFSQVQDRINKLGDALTSNLGNYFSNLAEFDEQMGSADDTYGQSDWTEARLILENKQKEFADELKDIFFLAFTVTSLDMAEKVAKLALSASAMGNPFGMLIEGAGNFLDFQDRLDDVLKSANVFAKLSFLVADFFPRLKILSQTMLTNFHKNEVTYKEIKQFLIRFRDKSFTSEHAKDFLKAYKKFTPALSDKNITEYGGLLEEMITECCNVIQNPETALSAVPAIVSAAMGSCPKARINIKLLSSLLGTINSKQTEIMSNFAKVARAKLAASNARNLRDSLQKSSFQKIEEKVLALKAFSLLKYHKLFLIEKACNYLTYMNFGAEPEECTSLLQNPNGDVGPLISMESCHMAECPNIASTSGVFRIPATFGVFEKGAIDLSSLYSIKDNKTDGSILLEIPDREWLLENKWVHSDQKGPFFIQSLNIFLPPMTSHMQTIRLKMASFASELNGKSYVIDKGTVIENSYAETLSKKCEFPNLYDREVCNATFRKYCIGTHGKINGKLLPRLENSIWKISLRSDHALVAPYPAEKFYLYAEATFWYKGVRNKKKAARRNTIHSDYLKCCLNETKFYNPVNDRCESCPEDSEPRLSDYYCEKCPAGYETSDGPYGCQPCKHGYYKKTAGPGKCQKCPEHKVALGVGSQFCI